MLILLFACSGATTDTAMSATAADTGDTGTTGTAPVISAMDVIWNDIGGGEFEMHADATVSDAEGDLVGGTAKFDVATGSGQPAAFEVEIKACQDVSGACWNDPHLIIAIPDVITANDYTVNLVVMDAAGNESASMSGFLAGG